MKSETVKWLRGLRKGIEPWIISMMDPQHFALFKDCVDAEMPHCLPASGVALYLMKDTRRLESLPGYSPEAVAESVAYAQSFQDSDTGLFIDPYLDESFENPEDKTALETFRGAVTKYAIMFLEQIGSQPLYSYSSTGGRGEPDPQAYLDYLRTADWSQPWGTGSGAAGRTKELYEYLNQGHEEVVPALVRGMEIILSYQNPETGMWGSTDLPLAQQVSGAFKIMAGPFWLTGFNFPYMDRLADSLLELWNSGVLRDIEDVLIPRNVAELLVLCLEASDYRHEEIYDTLEEVVLSFRDFQMPDGGFASTRDGTKAVGWCGASICGPADNPRSNMNATQGVQFCLSIVAPYLGWEDCPWPFPRGDWKVKLAQRLYQLRRTDSGSVEVIKR